MISPKIARIAVGFMLSCKALGVANADQQIGNFFVVSQEQYFGDGAGMAAWIEHGSPIHLGVRCEKDSGKFRLTVGGDPNRLSYDERVSVDVTVDQSKVFTTTGVTSPAPHYEDDQNAHPDPGWNATLDEPDAIIKAIADAREISVRATDENGNSVTQSGQLIEAKRALRAVLQTPCGSKHYGWVEKWTLPLAGNWMFGVNSPGQMPVSQLYVFSPNNMISNEIRLYCDQSHSWRLEGAEPDRTAGSEPIITYMIDDNSEPIVLKGKAVVRGLYRLGDLGARLAADLYRTKSKFAFAIGSKESTSVVDFSSGIIHDDIERMSRDCPLNPSQ